MIIKQKPFIPNKQFVLDIGEYIMTISQYDPQRQHMEIDSYNRLSPAYMRLIQWYCNTDYRGFVKYIRYRKNPNVNGVANLIDRINHLYRMVNQHPKQQLRILEGILEELGSVEATILEACLSKTLENVFPNFEWDYLKQSAGIDISKKQEPETVTDKDVKDKDVKDETEKKEEEEDAPTV